MGLHGQALTWAGAAELGFLAIYTVELLIRSIAEQWACLTDWWFIFDFTLVVSACVEQVVYRFTGDEADQIMILRLLRLIRLVRTFRMLRQIRSIWRLVYGLITCGETMFSTFALLGLVIYVFGVLGRQEPKHPQTPSYVGAKKESNISKPSANRAQAEAANATP